jgi:DNA polymerase-3 subunit epsilon
VSGGWRSLFRRPRRERWEEMVYWALDLETSGLDPRRDEILAVGMVPLRVGTVRWGERFTALVRPPAERDSLGAGFAVHQLLPGEVGAGRALDEVLGEVLARLADGVLLVHFAALDVAFLAEACRRTGVAWPAPPVVDTVRLLERLASLEYPRPAPSTQLAAARERLGLPPATEHDALADALATAELFLVVRRRLRAETLGELL